MGINIYKYIVANIVVTCITMMLKLDTKHNFNPKGGSAKEMLTNNYPYEALFNYDKIRNYKFNTNTGIYSTIKTR